MNNEPERSVAVIGAGGTITATAARRADFQTYRAGSLKTSELLESLRPELDDVALTDPVDFAGESGGCRTLSDFHAMSTLVDERLAEADAAVVLCGTRGLEELAYWLDLTVRSPKPVIVTGSMRPWNALGSDGPANLYNAIVLASAGRTTGFGTVVMLNDRILAAREATKGSTLRLDTYESREWGVLGTIDAANIRLLRAPARLRQHGSPLWTTPFDLSAVSALPRTEIAYSYVDASGDAITAFAAAGARGIVIAGDPSDRQGPAVKSAIAGGTVIVAANRNTSGAVYETGVPGIISAEDLLPQKARLLLTLGLALTSDLDQLRSWFHEYGVPEFG